MKILAYLKKNRREHDQNGLPTASNGSPASEKGFFFRQGIQDMLFKTSQQK
jgi:hypothetical protein